MQSIRYFQVLLGFGLSSVASAQLNNIDNIHDNVLNGAAAVSAMNLEEPIRLDRLPASLRRKALYCVASEVTIQFDPSLLSKTDKLMGNRSLSFEYRPVVNSDGSSSMQNVVNYPKSRWSSPICVVKFVSSSGARVVDDTTLLQRLTSTKVQTSSIGEPVRDKWSGNIKTGMEVDSKEKPSDLVTRLECFKGTGQSANPETGTKDDFYQDLTVEEILQVLGPHAEIRIMRRAPSSIGTSGVTAKDLEDESGDMAKAQASRARKNAQLKKKCLPL